MGEEKRNRLRFKPEGECRNWNKLQWWNWKINTILSSPLKKAGFDTKAFLDLLAYVSKKKLYMGTKVRYVDPMGKVIIGFIEEPLVLQGSFVTNLERTQYSGQNSWENYLIKYVDMEDLTIIQPVRESRRKAVDGICKWKANII